MSMGDLEMERIGLIGAGVMGMTVAPRILEAGYPLFAFDPSVEARAKIESLGAQVMESPQAVAERAEVIILFLPGPDQVLACGAGADGLLESARPGTIVIDMSTIDPGTTRRMAALAEGKGVSWLDAPVLGRPATVGRWALPVGGKAEDLERCVPIFKLFAARWFHIGGPGSGHKVKLLNQLMFSAINAMTAEMMAVSEKCGIPPKLLFETITASQAGTVSNLFKELGERIVSDDYANPTFPVDLLCKDVRLAIEMAQEAKAPPLLTRTIQFANEMAQAQGLGASDTAVMWKSFKRLWEDAS